MSARRALLIGPFPPPIGGDTVLTLNVSRSRHWGEHGITLECVNASPGGRVRVPDERLGAGDLMRGARITLECIMKLPRCGTVLLWANSRFILTEGIVLIALCAVFRKPVFIKVFGAYLARRIRKLPRPWRGLARSLLGRASCILPETNSLARELVEECGVSGRRVLVLPNFLPDASLGEVSASKRFTGACVFFGQIKREKGVFDIIEAVGGKANTRCDFYGPVLERDREAFLAGISRHPNLAYRGLVEPGAVRNAALAYDVLLLPTFHEGEGYPAVILEAFAAGIPVIATDWLSLGEMVENRTRGLIVPVHSPGKIREALDTLFADERLYDSMRRNASAYVRSFSERAVIGETLIPRVAGALS